MRNIIVIFAVIALAAPLSGIAAIASAEENSHNYSFGNGISATVYTPEGILSSMTGRDAYGNLVFYPQDGGWYYLIESVEDPLIINKGSGSFISMDEETVVRAIEDIDIGERYAGMHVDVYILPMPRLNYLCSTSTGCRIFLSPGVWEPSAAMISGVVTHEIGHCFQREHLPLTDVEGWGLFLAIRDLLDDPTYSESAVHMNRPSEIFAEDFRVLFGGDLAVDAGLIENPYLTAPDEVEGLADFIADLAGPAPAEDPPAGSRMIAAVGNYPNPFNPVTTIRADFSGSAPDLKVTVKVYAADGSLVRDLWSGTVSRQTLETVWDGLNDRGERVSSGIYFYRVDAGTDLRTGKMLLVR